jgi:hypothetical protein
LLVRGELDKLSTCRQQKKERKRKRKELEKNNAFTLIINSIKLSGTCIFTILLNSGFAIDLHC